jgi:phosphate transport system protein
MMHEQKRPMTPGGRDHGALRSIFDEAMAEVKDDVLRLGALVETALERSSRALAERNVELADEVRRDDHDVNELQRRVNQQITTAMALQQPMARDLRELLALYHAAAELERMGDYAVSIAKLAKQLAGEPEQQILPQIALMERLCSEQLRDAMRALVDVSEADARAVCARDDELDKLYNSVYEESMSPMERHPDRVRQTTHMLFTA